MAEQEQVPLVPWQGAGVAVLAPAGWEQVDVPDPGTPLVVVEPRDDGFRANLVVTRTDLAGMSFRDWQVGTDELLARTLTEHHLIDLERLTVAGRPGGRRLVHHVAPSGAAVVLEQWCTVVGGIGWALSATVDVERSGALAGVLASCAAGFVIAEAAA